MSLISDIIMIYHDIILYLHVYNVYTISVHSPLNNQISKAGLKIGPSQVHLPRRLSGQGGHVVLFEFVG